MLEILQFSDDKINIPDIYTLGRIRCHPNPPHFENRTLYIYKYLQISLGYTAPGKFKPKPLS
jgi:hypothetical protein